MREQTVALAPGYHAAFDRFPHILCCGQTGGGKSFWLLSTMVQFYTLGEIRVIDPKCSELFQVVRYALPETAYATTPHQIARLLREAHETMMARYERINGASQLGMTYRALGFSPLTLFFDEYAALVIDLSDDPKLLKEINRLLKRIVLLGRGAGVFVVIAMQQGRAEVLSTDIRDQLSVKVSLGSLSSIAYRMLFGDIASEMTFEYRRPSFGYLFIPGGHFTLPQPFQAPWVSSVQAVADELLAITRQRSSNDP